MLKSQSGEGPDRYREPRRFEIMPSKPIWLTSRSNGWPPRSNDALNRIALGGLRESRGTRACDPRVLAEGFRAHQVVIDAGFDRKQVHRFH
jgi:hypothetical protein